MQETLWVSLALCLLPAAGCGDSSPDKDSDFFFNFVHLKNMALPALLSYYEDMGSFPSKEEGWKSLFSNITKERDHAKWRGPYLSARFFSTEEGITKLNLLNGHAFYSCSENGQIVTLKLVGCDEKKSPFSRSITLLRPSDVKSGGLSKRQNRFVLMVDKLVKAITDCPRKNPEQPDDLDHLKARGKTIGMALESLQEYGPIHYEPLYAIHGYSLFFGGKGTGACAHYDLFSKAGECQVLVFTSNDKPAVFFAFGDGD